MNGFCKVFRQFSGRLIRAHKELARVLDKLGEYDKGFSHLQASAGLSGSIPEISRQDMTLIPEMIKQNKVGFSRELLGRWSRSVFPQEQLTSNTGVY